MEDILRELPEKAKEKFEANKKFFAKLKKKPPKNLDYIMQELHDAEFNRTDCLQCANCCKTTGPLFTNAGTKAVAPGKHSTLISIFTHSRTNKKAGSLIPGVPASVRSAIVFPAANCSAKCVTILCSLC